MKIIRSETPQELAEGFCHYLQEEVQNILRTRTYYSLALSGGNTPGMVFDLLATKFRDRFDWSKIFFFWGDERCVPHQSPESNFGNCRQRLLSHIPVPPENIFPIFGERNPELEAVRYGQLLQTILPKRNRFPVFDQIMLGLGEDGHTASLFPHELHLMQSENTCDVATKADTGQKRITLSGNTIQNASHISFLVSGSSKSKIFRQISENQAGVSQFPAFKIGWLPQVTWFCDKDATD